MPVIGLEPSSAYQRLRVQLKDTPAELRLKYMTRFGYYVITIVDTEADKVLVSGKGCHPGVELLPRNADMGSLYFRSRTDVNVDTIGDSAELVHEP